MLTAESENTAIIFDRMTVRRRRKRAAKEFSNHDFLFREVARRLADRLADIKRKFPLTIDLGSRGKHLSHLLSGNPSIETIIEMGLYSEENKTSFIGDEEAIPIGPACADLIISNLVLHWTNDLPGTLIQCHKILKPDGLFMGAVLGGETLTELRQVIMEVESKISGGISPRISPFANLADTASLLQRARFSLPVSDIDTITVTYKDLFSLMRDLRGMGETNAVISRTPNFSKRELFFEAAERYAERFGDSKGRIPATFQVLFLTGWAPATSQPQPQRPGSASLSLAQALETKEISAGEQTGVTHKKLTTM